jgi:hypothetical protein
VCVESTAGDKSVLVVGKRDDIQRKIARNNVVSGGIQRPAVWQQKSVLILSGKSGRRLVSADNTPQHKQRANRKRTSIHMAISFSYRSVEAETSGVAPIGN